MWQWYGNGWWIDDGQDKVWCEDGWEDGWGNSHDKGWKDG